MTRTIDMQDIRHLNLFSKITQVSTRFCFKYNETLIFCVPKKLVRRAVGQNGENIRKINKILGKRVKVVANPTGIEDAKDFMNAVINPVQFKEFEINGDEMIITAGPQNKAALIGRNKRRLHELQKISKDFFGKELRVV